VSLIYSKKGWEDDMINKNIHLSHTFLLIQIEHSTFLENVEPGGCWCEHQSQLIILQGWIFYTFKPKKNQYFSKKLVVRKKFAVILSYFLELK